MAIARDCNGNGRETHASVGFEIGVRDLASLPDRQLSEQAKQRSGVEGEHLELAAQVYLSLDSH